MAAARRRASRPNRRKNPRTRKTKTSTTSVREKVITFSIWGVVLINAAYMASFVSNIFKDPLEVTNSMGADPQENEEHIAEVVKVEVLNACGIPGLANQMAEYLREQDFDVVNVGNYSGGYDLDHTFVFDRVSLNAFYARKVGKSLGVERAQVAPQLDSSLQLMVTVLIGKDYSTLELFRQQQK